MRSFIVDRDGIVRWQNAVSTLAIGDWTGRKWFELVAVDETDEMEAFFRRILCSGDPAKAPFEIRELDGIATCEISFTPLQEGGAIVGFLGFSIPASTRASAAESETPPALTERQIEVLQLLSDGRSTRQIADELVLSETTVRNHIAHILGNLGVHTRVQAIIVATRAGLIRLSPPLSPH